MRKRCSLFYLPTYWHLAAVISLFLGIHITIWWHFLGVWRTFLKFYIAGLYFMNFATLFFFFQKMPLFCVDFRKIVLLGIGILVVFSFPFWASVPRCLIRSHHYSPCCSLESLFECCAFKDFCHACIFRGLILLLFSCVQSPFCVLMNSYSFILSPEHSY